MQNHPWVGPSVRLSVFEVVLSFCAFLSHDGREGGVRVVLRGTRGSRVSVEEQVEERIPTIEELHRGSIFTPMATAGIGGGMEVCKGPVRYDGADNV